MAVEALIVDGQALPLDKDGYLQQLTDWSEAAAEALAQAEGIQLSAEHWEVLHLLRRFYDEFQLSPANRPLIKYVALNLGVDKGNSLHLNRLFSGTPAKLAAKLAGLPKPTNCL
ncbi:TusE/DsrC/DsvC family sulfur relay protein [Pseudomonas sp. 5P_3.1_Bac2]|uniref:TusE/DsrC/DsvC family sulfur relay protein n=1 Tax=Pseudomonas sp. 5P_3.1_Bac2 TaxID=2971617 RepID=UPI0021C621D3|nr:TusE/DsrC/DsvC family sulfur relay protein [Pseudomonas sp. 5P_3.1_Bac2]MCU1717052.1 TusE/DsrC/DsvC family sulfur relay protein [Pseudomonas sp. 5P_3.1_Bac2]